MNTTENNKLIAEFMGDAHKEMKLQEDTVNSIRESLDLPRVNGFYHTSWDWLMPVVEKIEGIGASVIIGRFFCEIKYIDALNQEKQFEVRIASGIKINAVTSAVVNFIKWYNENK